MTTKKKATANKGGPKKHLNKGKNKASDVMSAMELRFVDHYLADPKMNATQAAISAGYSERAAHATANRLMKRERVARAIAAAMEARSKRTKIDADWLLTRLAKEATADLGDLYGENNQLLPIADWPEIWRQGLVTGIDVYEDIVDGVKQGGTVKVRMADRIRRLELIGKHINVMAFAEKHLHGFDESAADILAKARKRAGKE